MKYSTSELNKMIGAKVETTDDIIKYDILILPCHTLK